MYCVLLVPWFSLDLSPPSYTYLLHMCLINDLLHKEGSMRLINNMRLITRVYSAVVKNAEERLCVEQSCELFSNIRGRCGTSNACFHS